MTTTNYYPPGWWEAKQDGVAMSPEEISDYNKFIEVTEQEDEYFEQLLRLAGVTS